ncbi:MAG TPA: SpoIID/LytB domain-containing protein [Acidimicrobiales bacterium]
MRRVWGAAAVVAALVVPVGPPVQAPARAAAAAAAAAAVPVLVVDGRGFGHGVGMAQDGAYWMASGGARTDQILAQFYPGTTIGRGRGPVRAVVHDVGPSPTSVVLAFPDGGEVRDAPSGDQSTGFPLRVEPGRQVRVVWDAGRYRVEEVGPAGTTIALGPMRLASATRRAQLVDPPPTSTTTTTPSPASTTTTTTTAPPDPTGTTTTTAPPDGSGTTTTSPAPSGEPSPDPHATTTTARPARTTTRSIWAVPANNGTVELPVRQRRYRGALEATAATGTLRVVNQVDVETYLKGMGEVRDPRWPAAALRAQAIAARTYALRAMSVGGELCDTQRCQVYLGAQAEYAAMNKAVDATAGQVIVFGRNLASAVYSANGGGHSASREEGFGVVANDLPYLRPAPYPTQDQAPWSVTVSLRDVAARLAYPGEITSVSASRTGPSGRVLEVTVDGTAGPKPVPGIAFDAALGLRSTLFSLRLDQVDAAPPPPPDAEALIQALPEDAAAAVDEELRGGIVPARTSPTGASTPRVSPVAADADGHADEMAAVGAFWALVAAMSAVVLRLTRPTPGEHFLR